MKANPSYNELKLIAENFSAELQKKELEVEQIKHTFLSNISHEIRTPMNVIVGFSNLLNDHNYSDEQKRFFVSEINKNSKYLLQLIDQILLLTKLQNNDLEVIYSEFNIDKLFLELNHHYMEYQEEAGQTKVTIQYISQNHPAHQTYIKTDRDRLKQAIKCLIDNAIRFTKQGTISFGYFPSADKINIFVKDTGIGIDDKHLKLIFNKFYKVTTPADNKETGLGIGLTIAERLIKLLGGTIEVISSPGNGTEFNLSIRAKMATAASPVS